LAQSTISGTAMAAARSNGASARLFSPRTHIHRARLNRSATKSEEPACSRIARNINLEFNPFLLQR
jgi:homogentisate 1,2-dioxygenase